ncbi:hypothetical protein T12_9268 [Trichinella patagoniensis]|uniref:Uncharacterized protein n=1 Tax=Trichinella patagoniensis TaxID=990121 RepID=A0A0V0ZF82_9BILA|nr:hypothetical protein T12_9268 [Trichinella patagoniensis]
MEPNKKYFFEKLTLLVILHNCNIKCRQNIRNSSIEFYCNVLKKGDLPISTSGQLDFIFYVDILLAVSVRLEFVADLSGTSRKADTHQQPENVDNAKLNKYLQVLNVLYSNAARWMEGLRFDWIKN